MKNIVTSAWIVCAVFLCKISVADVVDSQKIPDVSVCIDNYENYLRSYKSIACSYAFNAPITNATGKMKYNGDHYWGLSDDGTMKMRIEILFDLPDKSIALYYKEEKKELSLFTWIVPPKNQGSTKLQNNLGIAEFFGYTNFFTASVIASPGISILSPTESPENPINT